MLQWKINGLGNHVVAYGKGLSTLSAKGKKSLRMAAFMSFVFGAMILPMDAFAQDAPVTETGTVVVTGTRTEQLIEDVPQTMQVFTQEDIQRMGASTVRDVLNTATGLSLEGQKGAINIRGMGFGTAVLLINGRKITPVENVKDAQSWYTTNMNANSIERIEIIRGQAGALYGSDAIGGVVNIITKKSQEKGGVAGVEMGNEYFKNYWQLDTGKMGGFDAIFNASAKLYYPGIKDTNRFVTGTDTKTGGWYKSADGMELAFNLDMGYAFNDDHELRFVGNYGTIDTTTDGKSTETSTVSTSYNSKRSYSGALVYNGTIEDHSFNISGTYSEAQVDKFSSGSRYYTDIFTNLTLNAYNSWSMTDWNTFTFGGEYSHSTTNQRTATQGDTLDYWSLFFSNETALFDDSVFILLQGRYDHYDAEFGGAFTPNIGVTWEFVEDHRIKANWGMGFRAPTLIEMFGTETTGNGTNYGSPDLKPEKSKNFELRYEGKYGPVSGGASYYYSYVEDKISSEETFDYATYEPLTTTGRSFVRTNIGKARMQGVELELAYQIHDYVTLKGSYVYSDAHNISDNTRVTYTATDVINGGVYFNYPEWGLSADLWATYNENYKASSTQIYDYYNVNFSAAKTWGEEDEYRVTLALYNFLQSKNNADNITSLNPFEVRVGFEMKF